jgi:hypothetical protein
MEMNKLIDWLIEESVTSIFRVREQAKQEIRTKGKKCLTAALNEGPTCISWPIWLNVQLDNNILNKSWKKQWNIYDQYIFFVILSLQFVRKLKVM